MIEKIGQIAEIVSEDSDMVNLWLQNRLENVEKESAQNRENLENLNQYIGTDRPEGIKNVLESKNETDPGHEHLFPPRNKTVIFTHFESLDGWATSGTGTEVITIQVGGTNIATGASTNNTVLLTATTTGFNSFDVSQASAFQTLLSLSATSLLTVYFGVGNLSTAADDGYGFKYADGVLSAVTMDGGSETLTAISNITVTNFNEYRAIWDTHSVVFMVNGRVVATHRANLPNTDDDVFFTYYIQTAADAAKTMYIKYMYFVQNNV